MQLTAVCFILLVSSLGTAYSHGCVNTLFGYVLRCYLSKTILGDTKSLCRQYDVHKNSIDCAKEYVVRCLGPEAMEDVLPDFGKMLDGMGVLCTNIKDFDIRCVRNKYTDILQCVKDTTRREMRRYQEADRQISVHSTICISADVNYDCSALHLTNCKKSTKAIYLEQLDKYQVPSVCPENPGRSRIPFVESEAANGAGTGNGAASHHPFWGTLVSMATLLFLPWSG